MGAGVIRGGEAGPFHRKSAAKLSPTRGVVKPALWRSGSARAILLRMELVEPNPRSRGPKTLAGIDYLLDVGE